MGRQEKLGLFLFLVSCSRSRTGGGERNHGGIVGWLIYLCCCYCCVVGFVRLMFLG